jgi:hypothetical protein
LSRMGTPFREQFLFPGIMVWINVHLIHSFIILWNPT